MKLIYLSAFRAVMLTGTISAAGEVINKSQPAVSRLLSKLEEDLGVTLFDRRKGLVTPTAEAYLLLDEIDRAYASLDQLRSFAERLKNGEERDINIAVMPALGITLIPDVLVKFRELYPRAKVVLSVRLSAKIESWAASQQIDLGIAETPFQRSGFRMEIFSNAPYLAAVPSTHPLADRPSLTAEDINGTPFISWTSFVTARHLVSQAFRAANVSLNPLYETSFSSSAYELVKRGLGIALIDPFTAIQQYDERVRIMPFSPAIPFNVALLHPEARGDSPAIRKLLEIAAQERDRILARIPT